MSRIHATAIVEAGAELGMEVEVGPYAVIGAHVRLGDGSSVGPHAVVTGHTTLGKETKIFAHAAVGFAPQDLKYAGEDTLLLAGDKNVFREFCTVHLGTVQGGGKTSLGSGNLIMAYAHVAHDCKLGHGNILANGATLAGHVVVEDHCILGGLSAVHQFVRIGSHAFLSGGAMVAMDVPPYCTVQGDRASLAGLNLVGLKRHGFSDESIAAIKGCYRLLFRSKASLADGLAAARTEYGSDPGAASFLDFVAQSERGVTR